MVLDCTFVHQKTQTTANYRIFGVEANGVFQAVQKHGAAAMDRLAKALVQQKVPMYLQREYKLVSHEFKDESMLKVRAA